MTSEVDRVTVTVTGLTGTGKSAIYGEIVNTLNALGIPVEHADPRAWTQECHMTHADWQDALDLYRPTVMMVEQNIRRGAPKKTWFQRAGARLRARSNHGRTEP